MPLVSVREQILDEVIARLERIVTTGGFATNAGANVHLGEAPPFGEDDAQAGIVVVVGDDEPKFQGVGFQIDLPLSIQAVVAVTTAISLRKAYRDTEAILADIKRAMELPDRTLNGLVGWNGLERGITQTLKRDTGSQYVGVAIEYRAPMRENWGNP